MISPAFKAGDSVLSGRNGGFDSHTLPPYLLKLEHSLFSWLQFTGLVPKRGYANHVWKKACLRDFSTTSEIAPPDSGIATDCRRYAYCTFPSVLLILTTV